MLKLSPAQDDTYDIKIRTRWNEAESPFIEGFNDVILDYPIESVHYKPPEFGFQKAF